MERVCIGKYGFKNICLHSIKYRLSLVNNIFIQVNMMHSKNQMNQMQSGKEEYTVHFQWIGLFFHFLFSPLTLQVIMSSRKLEDNFHFIYQEMMKSIPRLDPD